MSVSDRFKFTVVGFFYGLAIKMKPNYSSLFLSIYISIHTYIDAVFNLVSFASFPAIFPTV